MPTTSYDIVVEENHYSTNPTTIATYSMEVASDNIIQTIVNTYNGNNNSVLLPIQTFSNYGETTNEFLNNKFVMNEYNLLSTNISDEELGTELKNNNYASSPDNTYGFGLNILSAIDDEIYGYPFTLDITTVISTSQGGVQYSSARKRPKTLQTVHHVGRSANAYGDVVLAPIIYVNGEAYDVKSTKPHAVAYSAITEVVIPLSYELIGRDSFRDCSKLTKIIFLGVRTSTVNPIAIEKNAFINLSTKLNSSTPVTLYTSPLSSNNPVFDYFYKLYGDTINYSETPCFKEDTKILTDKGYVAIQHLRKGDMVKTLHDEYKAIAMIGSEEIHHNSDEERNRSQLFKYSSFHHPEVFEDLVITGGHSVLVDSLHENEEKETKQWINDCDMKVDNKYRLLAFVDETCDIYEIDGPHTIYHFALEGDYHKNYGVYANGLLVEACSQQYLKEHSTMTLIE